MYSSCTHNLKYHWKKCSGCFPFALTGMLILLLYFLQSTVISVISSPPRDLIFASLWLYSRIHWSSTLYMIQFDIISSHFLIPWYSRCAIHTFLYNFEILHNLFRNVKNNVNSKVLTIHYISPNLLNPRLVVPQILERAGRDFWWCGWWVWLGILSSVGLGTGLHTFLLYLGPHIASVTLAAYSCNSVNFPSPPYPEE